MASEGERDASPPRNSHRDRILCPCKNMRQTAVKCNVQRSSLPAKIGKLTHNSGLCSRNYILILDRLTPDEHCHRPLKLLCGGIDIWPDYWAASPRTAGRTFQTLSKFEQREPAANGAPGLRAHRQRKDILMTNGTVKFYNLQKGFGFIQPDDGGR